MNVKECLEYAKKNNVVMVDLRFTDWPGTWQHCSFPIGQVDEGTFEDGMGFDGSSIRGWQAINESDMLMIPDPSTAFIDPFFKHPTLVIVCDIVDPLTREPYHRDPRPSAQTARELKVLAQLGDELCASDLELEALDAGFAFTLRRDDQVLLRGLVDEQTFAGRVN